MFLNLNCKYFKYFNYITINKNLFNMIIYILVDINVMIYRLIYYKLKVYNIFNRFNQNNINIIYKNI